MSRERGGASRMKWLYIDEAAILMGCRADYAKKLARKGRVLSRLWKAPNSKRRRLQVLASSAMRHRPSGVHVDGCECNSCVPPGYTCELGTRVTQETRRQVERCAKTMGVSMAEVVRTAIECYLDGGE